MGDWRDTLVDVFQVASILSAATFATLGLFTDYKKDGKVTFYGRVAVVGIVLSALFSLGTRWAQTSLAEDERREAKAKSDRADEEAIAERAGQARNFARQMRGLTDLAATLAALQGRTEAITKGMNASLLTQERIQGAVGRSLRETAALGQQEDQNTARVLTRMWGDANRIDSGSIELVAVYSCPVRDGKELPRLLGGGTDVLLKVTPAKQLGNFRLPRTPFEPELHWLEEEGTTLTAFQHDFGWRRNRGTVDSDLTHVMRYGRFFSAGMESLQDPEDWRGAAIEILVTAPLSMSEEELAAVFPTAMGGKEALLDTYFLDPNVLEEPRYRAAVLPCRTWMVLTVNGRILAQPDVKLVLVSSWLGFNGPRLVLKSHMMRIDDSALPASDWRNRSDSAWSSASTGPPSASPGTARRPEASPPPRRR
jgi:hypothetical protein